MSMQLAVKAVKAVGGGGAAVAAAGISAAGRVVDSSSMALGQGIESVTPSPSTAVLFGASSR